MIQVNAYRGKGGGSAGRGGSRGGSRGGRGAGRFGYGGGSRYGRAPSSYGSRSGSRHFGKNVYSRTLTGHTGKGPGHYSWRATYGPGGGIKSLSRGYGPSKLGTGTYGQPGTNRGSFRISLKNAVTPGSSFGRRGGGGVSRQTAAVSPPSGGGGDDDGGSTPTPGSGTERSLRIRNSPARRGAFSRGRRAQGSRRSLRIGRSIGGLGGSGSRSGINV